MLKIDADKMGLKFNIYLQPRSSQNQIVGLHGDTLKVKIKAPPVDGAANKMCVSVLAKALKVPKSAIEIVSGQASRTKRLLVRTAGAGDPQREMERLNSAIHQLCKN
jgi:uncharacterized protein (TIGR00251 family)